MSPYASATTFPTSQCHPSIDPAGEEAESARAPSNATRWNLSPCRQRPRKAPPLLLATASAPPCLRGTGSPSSPFAVARSPASAVVPRRRAAIGDGELLLLLPWPCKWPCRVRAAEAKPPVPSAPPQASSAARSSRSRLAPASASLTRGSTGPTINRRHASLGTPRGARSHFFPMDFLKRRKKMILWFFQKMLKNACKFYISSFRAPKIVKQFYCVPCD